MLFGDKGSGYVHNHTRNSRLVRADRIAKKLQKAARSKESQCNKDLIHGLKSVISPSLALKVVRVSWFVMRLMDSLPNLYRTGNSSSVNSSNGSLLYRNCRGLLRASCKFPNNKSTILFFFRSLFNRPISDLIYLARWVKFNPRFNRSLTLIGL